jgi:hypothetical protein
MRQLLLTNEMPDAGARAAPLSDKHKGDIEQDPREAAEELIDDINEVG